MHTFKLRTDWRSLLFRDPESYADDVLPAHMSTIIPGKRGRLLSLIYTAGGSGNHPLVLMCHGFPGNEQNLDLAQAFRRIGFHACTFHYSGSWGSDGDYSFSHCIEDAETVLDHLLSHADELNIDTDRIFLFGHSLGGFVSANLYARRKEFRACILLSPADLCHSYSFVMAHPEKTEFYLANLDGSAAWLNGTSGVLLAEDMARLAPSHEFTVLSPALSEKPLLLITADYDKTTPFKHDQKPLLDALDTLGKGNHKHISIPTGHGYEDKRIALTETAAEYFVSML